MSSVAEERNKWRQNNRGPPLQQTQNRQNAGNQRQDSPREPAPPSNVWVKAERGKPQKNQNVPQPRQQQHTPVKGFTSQDVLEGLRKGYRSAQDQTARYKPTGGQTAQIKPGAWGPKASNMSNNKDFFVELRRQVTALKNTRDRAGG